jgi:hypothetical protein
MIFIGKSPDPGDSCVLKVMSFWGYIKNHAEKIGKRGKNLSYLIDF